MTTLEAIKELMETYDKCRKEWMEKLGDSFSEETFHAWFTKQVRCF